MKECVIGQNDAGQRVDKFVLKVTEGLPKTLLYKALRLKKIKVNRKRCEGGQKLSPGDTVQLFLSPDFFPEKQLRFLTLTPRLRVVFEDDNILVCDKEEGLSCHSDDQQKTGTLIDHIKAYLVQKGAYRPEEESSFAPALCNRIDRNTSGLVIAAKNAAALREVSEMIRDRLVEKRYLALARGNVKVEGPVTLYLKKDEEKNRVTVSKAPRPGFLTAITEIHPLSYGKERDQTLLSVTLHTGRTHQIRATLAHLGHPLVGDGKYGRRDEGGEFSHQALRSQSLVFHPKADSPLAYLDGVEVRALEDPRFLPPR